MNKYLIVGLGNIGEEYKYTRHNIGFLVMDVLSDEQEAPFVTDRLGDLAQFRYKGRQVFILKPSTYMNLSGKAVRYWAEKENIPTENILVVTDDLNLPFGSIRIKKKGSDGGHNGLKSLQNELRTPEYPRMRFGISSEFEKGGQVDYVLGRWTPEEAEALPTYIEKMAKAIKSFVFAGINNTMNTFNGK